MEGLKVVQLSTAIVTLLCSTLLNNVPVKDLLLLDFLFFIAKFLYSQVSSISVFQLYFKSYLVHLCNTKALPEFSWIHLNVHWCTFSCILYNFTNEEYMQMNQE